MIKAKDLLAVSNANQEFVKAIQALEAQMLEAASRADTSIQLHFGEDSPTSTLWGRIERELTNNGYVVSFVRQIRDSDTLVYEVYWGG